MKWAVLILAIVAADQLSKWLVVSKIPMWANGPTLIGDDFLRIIHIRNKAAGFGLGRNLSGFFRIAFIYLVPGAVMAWLAYTLYSGFKNQAATCLEKTALSLIIAGGVANLIDRIFRADGVVDFIDVKFYGILGMERWPAFNLADSSVVIGVILLLIAFLIGGIRKKRA